MARPTIEQIRSVGDFQSLFRWDVLLTPPQGVAIGVDKFNFLCETTTLPKATLNTYEINIRGHKVIQNGILTYDNTLTLTFVETVDATIRNFIREWRERLWKTGTGVAADATSALKTTMNMNLLDNQDRPNWKIKINGLLLQDYDLGQVDGTSSDAMRPTITFSYDYFEEIV